MTAATPVTNPGDVLRLKGGAELEWTGEALLCRGEVPAWVRALIWALAGPDGTDVLADETLADGLSPALLEWARGQVAL